MQDHFGHPGGRGLLLQQAGQQRPVPQAQALGACGVEQHLHEPAPGSPVFSLFPPSAQMVCTCGCNAFCALSLVTPHSLSVFSEIKGARKKQGNSKKIAVTQGCLKIREKLENKRQNPTHNVQLEKYQIIHIYEPNATLIMVGMGKTYRVSMAKEGGGDE